MRSPVFWRRSSTAAGVYLSAALGVLGGIAIAILAPLSHLIWAHGLAAPMLVAALLPIAQAPEGIAAAALIVRRRYDVRAAFLVVSMALRLAALAAGAAFGVIETVVALLAAQLLATGAIGVAALVALRRFPAHEPAPLDEDRVPFRRFVIQSSLGSVLSPMRGLLGTLLLGVVAGPKQVSYLRIGQTPESAFASLSSPVRLILLTEQTHHVEQGRSDRAYRMLRRDVTGAAGGFLIAACAFAAVWTVLLVRLRREPRAATKPAPAVSP